MTGTRGMKQEDMHLINVSNRCGRVDYMLLGLFGCLFIFGLLAVTTSSYFLSKHALGWGGYYLSRHIIHGLLALLVVAVAYLVPTKTWQASSTIILFMIIAMLVMVLIPGVGRSVNGAYRWVYMLGVNIQVSEPAKLGLILYLSSYMQRKQQLVQGSIIGALMPLIVMFILSGLILLEPDFGGACIILTIGVAMLFFAGMPWRVIVGLAAILSIVMFALAFFTPYRLARLTAFFDPWSSPFGDGYQLTQSLMAIGRGGVTGVGLGYGLQKQLYLPEAHTDFVFAVLAEEIGLIGSIIIVLCFVGVGCRCLYWTYKAARKDYCYEAMCIYGMLVWWSVSAIFSMSVNLGLVPTKGIALPFMSYGGSNLLVNACALGILLRMTKEISKE